MDEMNYLIADPPYLVPVSEAARLTGISEWLAWQLIGQGKWPSVRIGRRRLIPLAGLRAWIDANTEGRA